MEKEKLDKYIEKFREIEKIFQKYGMKNPIFDTVYENMENFKIAVPLIGSFSSGKTALINALINKKMFKTSITPETDIPVEITYGNKDQYFAVTKENGFVPVSEAELTEGFDVNIYNYLSVKLNNEFLKSIDNIIIVDMPGFDSGIELHNMAIDNYIGKSRAYIIVNDIEDGTIKKSILDVLVELNILDKPVYSVVNKSDKRPNDAETVVLLCKEKIEEKMHLKNIAGVSARKKEIEPLKQYLKEINSNAGEIFEIEFKRLFFKTKQDIIKYISIRLRNSDKDLIQFEIEEEKLKNSIESLAKEFESACKKIDNLYGTTIQEIEASLNNELMNRSDAYAQQLMNGGNVGNDINLVIRKTYMEKIKNYFEPEMIKYFEAMQNSLFSFDDINLYEFDSGTLKDTTMKNSIQAFIIMMLERTGLELGGVVTSIIGIVTDFLFGKVKEAQKLEQAKSDIRSKISEIINSVIFELESNRNYLLENIYDSIKKDMNKQKETINKAIKDVKNHRQKKEEEQIRIQLELEEDLNFIQSL